MQYPLGLPARKYRVEPPVKILNDILALEAVLFVIGLSDIKIPAELYIDWVVVCVTPTVKSELEVSPEQYRPISMI